MTTIDAHRATWSAAAAAPVITPEIAMESLRAMEFSHTRYLDEQKPVAARIAAAMRALGRDDLAVRADLVLGGIAIRQGALIDGSATAENALTEAGAHGDPIAMARAHYLLAWVSYFVGDRAAAQIHATHAVELLPENAEMFQQLDHLVILAIACDNTPQGQQYFDEALVLATRCGDPYRSLTLHNNIAFSAVSTGNIDRALEHVALMTAESERSGVPLSAIHIETVARAYVASGQCRRAIDALAPLRAEYERDGETRPQGAYYSEPHALTAGMLTLAGAHRELGELDEAQHVLEAVRTIVAGGELEMFTPQILEEQARIDAAREDFASAFRHFVAFHEAMVAQQNEEQQSRARLVQASFHADRNRRDAERFRELAMRDALTGLHNRRFLDDLLTREVESARTTGAPLSVGIADADYFKRVNDEHSHKVGDQVLRELAALLVAGQPEGATVCRLGGEEFAVIMPNLGAEEARAACESLRRAVADRAWDATAPGMRITISIGVTTALDGRTSPAALLSDADRNLYAAKRSGRNRVMGDVP